MKSTLLLPLALMPLLLFSACTEHDYYSEVIGDCNYYIPPGKYDSTGDFPAAYLKPECKAALEAILPYDDESFKKARPGFKDKVTEAFQSILPYKLALPFENRVLGIAPYSIPSWHLELFAQEENPQKAIFNHLVSLVQTIVYDPVADGSTTAKYTPRADLGGKLTIYDLFVDQDGSYTGPFNRSATLIHEGRHGDGYFHASCEDGQFACDPEPAGPYGIEITYYEMLMHGSGNRSADGTPSPLSDADIGTMGWGICALLLYRVDVSTEHLAEEITRLGCYGQPTSWYIATEGLVR